MSGIAAVLLAAGESRRMGAVNKLALRVRGETLLRRSAEMLLGSALSRVVVVLGHEAEAAAAMLDGLPVKTVHNASFADGQMSSVSAGLRALEGSYQGVMIALADQPLLESADIDHLIDVFRGGPDTSVLVPVHRGQRGNPIILAYGHRAVILNGDRNLGCRRFIERNPELVTTLEVDSDHYVVDLDTPQDYEALGDSGQKQDDKERSAALG